MSEDKEPTIAYEAYQQLTSEYLNVCKFATQYEQERNRALAMLEKMAGAIDVAIRGLVAKGIGNAALNDALAEYRREFGEKR